jgi:anti-sigma factor RsiW
MDHEAIKQKLSAYYDKELEASSCREIETHLPGCPECREQIERWQKTSALFFPKSRPVASEFFVQQVMTRIGQSQPVPQPALRKIPLPWLVPALGLAAMFLIVIRPLPQFPLSLEALLVYPQDMGISALSAEAMTMDETLEFIIGGSL